MFLFHSKVVDWKNKIDAAQLQTDSSSKLHTPISSELLRTGQGICAVGACVKNLALQGKPKHQHCRPNDLENHGKPRNQSTKTAQTYVPGWGHAGHWVCNFGILVLWLSRSWGLQFWYFATWFSFQKHNAKIQKLHGPICPLWQVMGSALNVCIQGIGENHKTP